MGRRYTHEEKETAIKLFKELGHITAVMHTLGYPSSRTMLYTWIRQERDGSPCLERKTKYTAEQRKTAVEYYLKNGRSISKTVTALGYPGKTLLKEWLKKDLPEEKLFHYCNYSGNVIKYNKERKAEIITEYCSGRTPKQLSARYGISPGTVYTWKRELLGSEIPAKLKTDNKEATSSKGQTKEELLSEIKKLESKCTELKEEVCRLQMQKDILEKVGELLKKGAGISLVDLSNREKAVVIDALRNKYRLGKLLSELKISKSSYCYQRSSMAREDKYTILRIHIAEIFIGNYSAYGYRRICGSLKRMGVCVSEKVVRRLMREDNLQVKTTVQKKYSSYKGEISPEVPNLIQRDFHSDRPNEKWLTDITEFRIPAGKVYLSPIIDCYDGSAVSWTIGTSPDAELVNHMLDNAVVTLKECEKPVLHSDRGCHYRWPGWIERMQSSGLCRSMSRKACSPDNSACEGFFGRLKNEMFYGRSWIGYSIEEFMGSLDRYIRWYNEKRIKKSLGYLSPSEYRLKNGFGVAAATLDGTS